MFVTRIFHPIVSSFPFSVLSISSYTPPRQIRFLSSSYSSLNLFAFLLHNSLQSWFNLKVSKWQERGRHVSQGGNEGRINSIEWEEKERKSVRKDTQLPSQSKSSMVTASRCDDIVFYRFNRLFYALILQMSFRLFFSRANHHRRWNASCLNHRSEDLGGMSVWVDGKLTPCHDNFSSLQACNVDIHFFTSIWTRRRSGNSVRQSVTSGRRLSSLMSSIFSRETHVQVERHGQSSSVCWSHSKLHRWKLHSIRKFCSLLRLFVLYFLALGSSTLSPHRFLMSTAVISLSRFVLLSSSFWCLRPFSWS
jgi:hypothetical protein